MRRKSPVAEAFDSNQTPSRDPTSATVKHNRKVQREQLRAVQTLLEGVAIHSLYTTDAKLPHGHRNGMTRTARTH